MESSQKIITRWFFLAVAGIVLYLFWQIIEPFALVLLTAVIIAVVLMPLMKILEKYIKSSHLSAVILVIGLFICIIVPFAVGALIIAQDAKTLLDSSFGETGFLSNLDLSSLPGVQYLPETIRTDLTSLRFSAVSSALARWAANNATSFLASAANLFFNTFIFVISLYYILVDREKIRKQILELSPFQDKLDLDIINRLTKTIRNVVSGALIVSMVQGIMAAIGMIIFGVPGAVLWGAVTILASQVPILGVGLVLGPAVIYLLITGSTSAALGLLIWGIAVVGLVDNILSPQLIKGKTNMHALLILISILGGLKLFGYIGFIAGPTILASLMVLIELYKRGILNHDRLQKLKTK